PRTSLHSFPTRRSSDLLAGNGEANQITIEIRDTGEGIPADLLPRLFEPFASAKERGTGLGLAVSRRILQEHGGSIAVRPGTHRGDRKSTRLNSSHDQIS